MRSVAGKARSYTHDLLAKTMTKAEVGQEFCVIRQP